MLKIVVLHFVFLEAFIGIRGERFFFNETTIAISCTLLFLLPLWRLLMLYTLKLYRTKGFNFRNVAVIGDTQIVSDLLSFFKEHPEHGYRFHGKFIYNIKSNKAVGTEDFKEYCRQNKVDEVFCSLEKLSSEEVKDLLQFCRHNLIRTRFLPHAEGFNYHKIKVDFYDLIPVIELQPSPLYDRLNGLAKRAFDLVFSIIVIVLVMSWLTPLIAIVIKISSPGPVFFRQKRSGLGNADFWCYKFRSMSMNKNAHLKQASKNDSRVTPFGRFLRSSSLDEMPQFFNVLLGNMSVVGPRPHMLKHTEMYSQQIDNYLVRHYAKPGITGLSQVMGYRGETKELRLMRNRVKMDIFYFENWSFWLDIKIIYLTVLNVIKKDDQVY